MYFKSAMTSSGKNSIVEDESNSPDFDDSSDDLSDVDDSSDEDF